jgi:hypothetical protein
MGENPSFNREIGNYIFDKQSRSRGGDAAQ